MSNGTRNGVTLDLVTPPEVEEGKNNSSQLAATSLRDELAACIQDLRERGVTHPDEFASLGVDVLRDTVAWFDAQDGRVTAGVLVLELRAGGKRRPTLGGSTAGQRSREYAEQIATWLNRYFPDLQQSSGNPHPAAVVEVIHLHHELGKGRLLAREHQSRIRASVRRFNAKWLEPA